ncbi:uncharacterized protein LOC121050287 isoform X3 [Rosa chinensis]|uniref:uncharacterized protein LOC121050287 isoform X3 n=1 Tax=Rosa chinensis TaxID=74649 RepID=UPI001AD8C0A1|nr:uncharacterized protein LOC121050287 isoform X3 [Rosa chinensis]
MIVREFFSVRRAYVVARDNLILPVMATSSSSPHQLIDTFWKCKVPGKVKLCLWKACQDFLPTRSNLVKKKMEVELFCPLCENKEETPLHIFRYCPIAKQMTHHLSGMIKCGRIEIVSLDLSSLVLKFGMPIIFTQIFHPPRSHAISMPGRSLLLVGLVFAWMELLMCTLILVVPKLCGGTRWSSSLQAGS